MLNLIFDQPEENLDPKFVFDELVALFFVAPTGPLPSGGQPPITYVDGLDSADIRKSVCNILRERRGSLSASGRDSYA